MSDERINASYASLQIHRALQAMTEHNDKASLAQARKKVDKWNRIIGGLRSGKLQVGSRTPVKGMPAWLTLEVATGGFATGQLAASGEWLPFELNLLAKLDVVIQKKPTPDRTLLNYYYISEGGFAELLDRVESGNYEVNVPEEGALLVVAWLAKNGFVDKSQNLIDVLAPYFSSVRFYPQPADTPQAATRQVFLRDVKTVSSNLSKIQTPHSILAQSEAIHVWRPFREKVVSFLLSTCDGEIPRLINDAGAEQIEGGALNLHVGAHSRAASSLVDEYKLLRKQHRLCRKPLRKDSLGQSMVILEQFVRNGELSAAMQLRLGVLCARYVAKRGTPTSDRHEEFARRQRQQVEIPNFVEIAKVVLHRLAKLPQQTGVENFAEVSASISAEEANGQVPAGSQLPETVMQKLERCMMDSAEVLLQRRVIKSGDSLATVLPQITGNVRANGINNASLRTLYAAIYRAFRRRRSVLLLDYESQVRIEELPWIEVIEGFRSQAESEKSAALLAMKEIALLAIVNFPYAIIPNKLLQEFRAVAKAADLEIPFVDELAADIFMGGFSNKFAQAAQIAADLLQGSLYETYYQIDFEMIKSIKLRRSKQKRRSTRFVPSTTVCKAFGDMCRNRAVKGSSRSFVAKNGVVIEQQQILTTQNLAAIIARLDLTDELRPKSIVLAQSCFQWVCNQLEIPDKDFHARLIKVKNAAYAWRQMVCFLSLAEEDDLAEFATWATEYLDSKDPQFAERFCIALNHLDNAISANLAEQALPASHQPFLGWSLGEHWLLETGTPDR